jgi:hypothetical protein
MQAVFYLVGPFFAQLKTPAAQNTLLNIEFELLPV